EQWLCVTMDQIFVFSSDPDARPFHVKMNEIEAIRATPVVGSGIVQIRSESTWFDLVRYSNRLKYTFDRVVRRLEQIRRGEEPLPEAQDAQDPQRCPKCDLMLEFPGEICPRCVDHAAALTRVIRLMGPYWKSATSMTVLLLVGVALDMVWPLLTRFLVD